MFGTISTNPDGTWSQTYEVVERNMVSDGMGHYWEAPGPYNTYKTVTSSWQPPVLSQDISNQCFNCGWHPWVGFEGEASIGLQGGFDISHSLGLEVDVASIVVAEAKLGNRDISGNSAKLDNFTIKQGFTASYIGSFAYKHSFNVKHGAASNEQHEFRAGLSFIGVTATFNENWDLSNLFLGLDPSLSGAFIAGGEIKYKIGFNYGTGK